MPDFPCVDIITELSLKKFKSLPKTGKPTSSEWTVLSSIIQFDCSTGETKVVALGAGTKCIGQSKLCPNGLILNDSHAEVLARRAFVRYLFHQLKDESTLFFYDETNCVFRAKESVSFHFFSTQTPCGDACIVSNLSEPPTKRIRVDNESLDVGDVLTPTSVFTGAKLIGGTESDPMLQTVGALRTKPGRGERTLSMSCSDKLSRWNIMGWQGALLDSLLEKPIFMESLDFSCDFDMDSMRRAIYGRWQDRVFENKRFSPQKPFIRRSTMNQFEHNQNDGKNPSPSGLAWCDVPEESGPYEVSVNGKKQGITKKVLHLKKSALKVSKAQLLKEFGDVLKKYSHFLKKLELENKILEEITYSEAKQSCTQYQLAWRNLRESYFKQWTIKPSHLLEFTLNSLNKQT